MKINLVLLEEVRFADVSVYDFLKRIFNCKQLQNEAPYTGMLADNVSYEIFFY